jgi:hypothetical protein
MLMEDIITLRDVPGLPRDILRGLTYEAQPRFEYVRK